ncbi:hypothetical protein ACLKA7_016014 [Drosophila subpalustris]
MKKLLHSKARFKFFNKNNNSNGRSSKDSKSIGSNSSSIGIGRSDCGSSREVVVDSSKNSSNNNSSNGSSRWPRRRVSATTQRSRHTDPQRFHYFSQSQTDRVGLKT